MSFPWLPEDPNRVLGGHSTPKKQKVPVPIYNQISEAATLRKLKKRSGIRLSRKYHAMKLKEFKDQAEKDRVYGVQFVGQKLRPYTTVK